MKPECFVPAIVRAFDREKPWGERLRGSVLFADVSGFTPMAESLSVLEAEGGEILTDILNRYFSETVGIIHSSGGEVMKFGGDSILCFFRDDAMMERASFASQQLQRSVSKFHKIKTPVRKFSLQMKIGISAGDVLLASIGIPTLRCEYILAGQAVNRACEAEQLAKAGDVIVEQNNRFEKLQITDEVDPFKPIQHDPSAVLSNINIKPFLIPEIYETLVQGYDRYAGALQRVIPVFMQLEGLSDKQNPFALDELQQFFIMVNETAQNYGGRFNAFTTGDKGQVFYLLFGAPNRLERKEEAANQWALEVLDCVRRDFPKINIRIGMTEGPVFAGIVGGSGRFHYTVVGDPVNLAARLMTVAPQNQICVSEDLKKKSETSFDFVSSGYQRLKGKTQPIQIYRLDKRRTTIHSHKGLELVGRKIEIEEILQKMEAAQKGMPQMIVVEGEAGIGKSCLADRIVTISSANGWRILSGASEITRQNHAYAPWASVFKSLISDSKMVSLQQTSAYDEKTQKTILHHRLSVALLEAVGDKPVLLVFENLHWFDSLSLELLAALLNHLKQHRFLLLAIARPEWQKEEFVGRENCHLIHLSELSRSMISEMAKTVLGSSVKDALLNFLYQSARGNPFFTLQLLEYLNTNDALIRIGGEWTVRRGVELSQSLSGEELIISQIERCTWIEKDHLRTASCMGPTYSLPVLQKTLGKNFRKEALQSLFQKGYLQQGEESWDAFSQSLIQEAVYHSLPKGIRKGIHRRIGKAMESIFQNDLKQYYPNLANHFRLAELRAEAIHYSIEAADSLYKALSFPESRFYFQSAFDLLNKSSDARKWDIGLKLVKNLIHTGKLAEGLQLARKLRTVLKRRGLHDFYYQSCILQFDIMRRLSDYSYLRPALKLLKEGMMSPKRQCQILHLVGSGYFWLGLPERAERYLADVTATNEKDMDPEAIISAHVFLANIFADRQEFDSAYRTVDQALSLSRKMGYLYQEMRIRSEWAGILCDHGKAREAKQILTDLIPEAEGLGDFYLIAAILTGIGQASIEISEWETAEAYLNDALKLFSSIGVLYGKAKTLMWFGIMEFYRERYEKAYEYYKTATESFVSAHEMVEACHGYYNLAEVCVSLNRFDEAAGWYDKGIHSFHQQNNPRLAELYQKLDLIISNSSAKTGPI